MAQKKNIVELTRCSTSEYRGMTKLPFAVMTDNIRSLHNIGSLFRTCDAFLAHSIVLGGISGRPPHPEITKTALGAENSVSWYHVDDTLAEAVRLKEEGWTICVLEQAHDSVLLHDFHVRNDKKYLIVAGNEVEGVDQRIVDIADVVLEIPQCGVKHSLNVSVSAGIALWHFFSQLHA